MTRPSMLVTGGSGFLGGWVARLARPDWRVTATYLTEPRTAPDIHWRRLDVRDESMVAALMERVCPRVVVHAAALNPGQGTEFEAVNARGTHNVARAAARLGARLIHISTDVVFDGEKGGYVEEDHPSPVTAYGHSKALAEEAVRGADVASIIVRTSLLYGAVANAYRRSLKETPWQDWDRQTRWVVGDLEAGRTLHLFTDEIRCPIYVVTLASALLELAQSNETGKRAVDVLHVAGTQPLSRYAFGLRLARFHGVDPAGIVPALSRQSGMARPLDCTLDCSRAQALLRTSLPGVDQVLAPAK